MRHWLMALVWILGVLPIHAQDADYLLLQDEQSVSLMSHAQLFADSTGTLTIEEVMKLPEHQFNSIEQPKVNSNYPAACWVNILLIAQEEQKDKWIILKGQQSLYPYLNDLDLVDLYVVKNGKVIQHERTGYAVPKSEKAIQERASANVLSFEAQQGDTLELFFQIKSLSRGEPLYLNLELSNPVPNISFTTDWNKFNVIGGQAMHLIIGFYTFILWFFVRQRAYLFFSLFCLMFSGHYFFLEPAHTGVDLLFPQRPWLANTAFPLFASGGMLFLFLFGYAISNLKNELPRWDLYFRVFIGITCVVFVANMAFNISPPYNSALQFSFFLFLILLIPLCIRVMFTRNVQAKIFAFGLLYFMVWLVIGILYNLGILNLPFVPFAVGQIGMLLIYGIGLGYNFLLIERERGEATRLKELDSIKSRFFANISHEFRTPLSLILGPVNQAIERIPASESVQEAEDIPVKGKYLKMIRRNANRLQQLVDQLLDLSKLDSGKMQIRLKNGQLIAFLRALSASFESMADQKHISYMTSYPEEPDDAWFDPNIMDKIVVNLLSNAFKFTPDHGSVQLKVTNDHQQLKIAVTDSGPGIPAKEVDKIFSRFFQVEGTESKGSGIGLALVRELVDLLGGHIAVDSVVGQGTTFKVVLPHQKQAFDEKAVTFVTPSDSSFTSLTAPLIERSESGQPEQQIKDPELPIALVVEDNPDLRLFMFDHLKTHYQVFLTENGEAGIQKAIELLPDIIISDVMMPEKDGFEVCETLKADTRTSHIPLILLTAKAELNDKIAGLKYGADDYLTKPFEARELLARMENMIRQRQALREHYSSQAGTKLPKASLHSMDERFLKEVFTEVEKNIGNEYYTVEELARSVGFSRSQLHRKLKALTGKTSNQLIRDFRLQRAKEMLESNTGSVSEIAYEVGYSSLSYFSKSYKAAFGILPSDTKIKKTDT